MAGGSKEEFHGTSFGRTALGQILFAPNFRYRPGCRSLQEVCTSRCSPIRKPRSKIRSFVDGADANSPFLIQSLAQRAKLEHAAEFKDASLNFPTNIEMIKKNSAIFDDSDFESHDIRTDAHAGPDARYLRNPSRIHITKEKLVSDEEIRNLVSEAAAAMRHGATSNFTYTKRHNLDEVHTAHLPAAKAWLTRRLSDSFFPLLANRYGIDASSLSVFDSLIVHYDVAKDAVRQPAHRDASFLTLNVALSSLDDDYSGGGVFFESLGGSLSLSKGHVMCHPSGMRHGGNTIISGDRWVLVVFVISESVEHATRRIADQAYDTMMSQNDFGRAETLYRASIAMDRSDYELHYGLASALARQGRVMEARRSLLTAIKQYPLSPKPHLALGSLLFKSGRLRAGMRCFEAALSLTPDFGEDDAWEAARYSGLCAVRLGQKYGPSYMVAVLLQVAEMRLRQSLEVQPSDMALRGLLEQAVSMRAQLDVMSRG